jgi:hypothetical protein
MEGRVKVTEAQLMNRIDYDMYQNGTGNGGKNLTGLAAAVADDPTSGTYGGISRVSWPFWRNQFYRGVSDGGAAVSAANIVQYLTTQSVNQDAIVKLIGVAGNMTSSGPQFSGVLVA